MVHGRYGWRLVGEVDLGVVAAVVGGQLVVGDDELDLAWLGVGLGYQSPVKGGGQCFCLLRARRGLSMISSAG